VLYVLYVLYHRGKRLCNRPQNGRPGEFRALPACRRRAPRMRTLVAPRPETLRRTKKYAFASSDLALRVMHRNSLRPQGTAGLIGRGFQVRPPGQKRIAR